MTSLPIPISNLASRLRSGFTLMEVNIALMVVAVGLTSLLALFPVGLRESNTASADTVQSAVASYIFARLHENAAKLDWGSDPKAVIAGDFKADGKTNLLTGSDKNAFEGTDVRYKLEIGEVKGYKFSKKAANGQLSHFHRHYYAALRVSDRKTGDIDREPVFYTEFIQKGMTP